MATIKRFEDLEIWQLAREIGQFVEELIQTTGLKTNYTLRNQMESSSGSIMDNIAEGFGRDGNKEFHNFLSIAKGSSEELRSQSYRAFDKKLINLEQHNKLNEMCELEKNKIGSFMHYLRNTAYKGQKFNNNNKQ